LKFLALSFGLLLAGCASMKTTTPVDDPNESKVHSLSRDTAALRARLITRVSYTLWFGLDEQYDDFQGRTVIRFDLREKAKNTASVLPVDLNGAVIRSLSINGTTLDPAAVAGRYDGREISLRTSELNVGQNRVEVSYSRKFSTTGSGFHRYKDAEDGTSYVFTDLEPFEANKVFPCFDQPDLKASYELTVEAPESWTVISNTPEREITSVDGHKSWQFPPSPAFSTYVFALHAGPFKFWKADANGIPMRLFTRKSLAAYGEKEAKEWFDITREGLAFFAMQFGYPYPYAKYDQIILPEFNSEAMENVAAVTFTEDYLYRSRVTEDTRRGRAETILHELAHMWFGNLVTMRWWNGLWLNESFATFAASWALEGATRFGDYGKSPQTVWQAFFTSNKQWAYWEDQLVTTHPMDVSVRDTSQAFANFDGITYGKGASVIKQLRFALGDEDFREGLQRYFLRHAYRNTTLADFVRALGEAAGTELGDWQRAWLQTSGVNTVEAAFTCEVPPGKTRPVISNLKLLQRPSEKNGILRPHRTRVALLDSRLVPMEILDVHYSQLENPVREAAGKPCPAAVFPNWGDEDYVKVSLDPATLALVQSMLGRVPDPFVRQMLWHTLWESVIDGRLSAAVYARIALTQLNAEKNTQLLKRVLQTLVRAEGTVPSVLKFTEGTQREALAREMESFLRRRFIASEPGSDGQLIWLDAWLRAPLPVESLQKILGYLDGKHVPQGLAIDQDRRWAIVHALARMGHAEAPARIAAERLRDATEAGRKEAIGAEASRPDAEVKAAWWARLTSVTPAAESAVYNDSQLRDAMFSLQPFGQEALVRAHADDYFDRLPGLLKVKEELYLSVYSEALFPSLCDPAISARANDLAKSLPGLSAAVVKNLRVGRQEDERCARARALAAQPAK